MNSELFASVLMEEYRSAVSIFQSTVDRYYRMFATIITVSSILFGAVYHYMIQEGFVVFVFLFLALLSLESYLRFTAASNAIYTEYIEQKINHIIDFELLEWYHKGTHGKYLLTPRASWYSFLFLSRYIPFLILFSVFILFSFYEGHKYVVSLGVVTTFLFDLFVGIGVLSVATFNVSFSIFLRRYRNDLNSRLEVQKQAISEKISALDHLTKSSKATPKSGAL